MVTVKLPQSLNLKMEFSLDVLIAFMAMNIVQLLRIYGAIYARMGEVNLAHDLLRRQYRDGRSLNG
jgi:hypothetical protein